MTADMIEQAAHRFALLGDPTRLRILHTVMERGELSVGAIAEFAGASRFNTSAHLNRLAGGAGRSQGEGSPFYHGEDEKNLPHFFVCFFFRCATPQRPFRCFYVGGGGA